MKEWYGCAAWFACAIGVLVVGADLQVVTRFGPGPGFFLRGLAFALLALAAIQAIVLALGHRRRTVPVATPEHPSAVLFRDDDEDPLIAPPGALAMFAGLSASMFGYAVLLEPLGFIVATVLLCFAAMTLLGRAPLRSAIESVIAIAIAYALFGIVLGVNLPSADLAWLAGLGL